MTVSNRPARTTAPPMPRPAWLRRPTFEILLVLGLSLGQSAVYAIVSLIASVTASTSLSSQSTTLNASASSRPWLDITYQVLGLGFGMVPVLLALYLLATPTASGASRIGLTVRPVASSLGGGLLLTLAIGVPGVAFYALGRIVGLTVNVVPAALGHTWWAVPVLLLAALRAALLEEVIVVGYLFDRLRAFGWHVWVIVVATAVLRGSYHLYQGWGPGIGNLVMGLVFGAVYVKWRRTSTLVVAHFLLDALSFVGYALAAPWLKATMPGVFG